MSTFAYIALARDGKRTSGTLSADTRAAAVAQVVQRGLHPVRIDEAKAAARAKTNGKPQARAGDSASKPPRGGRVSGKAVAAFTRELANLLSGGVPLARALHLLRREASSAGARYVWSAIHDDVVGGSPLADAMAKWPKNFSGVYVAMVRAGEAGGFLDVVLGQISDFRTREADLKGKVHSAMIYPLVLAIVATGVLTFLMTYFIPRFSGIFSDMGGELPLLTQIIVTVSNAMTSWYGFIIAIVLISAILGITQYLRTQGGRRQGERVILAMPALGVLVAHFALVRFARMLGTLVGAGVPLIAALKVAREAIGNQTLADTVTNAINEVQRGSALSKSLAESPRLFPPSVVETIAIAEETGRLDKELVRLAIAYEADLERQLRMVVAIVEPFMLLIMAGLIGTVVVGMLLPIFNLQDLIK